MDTAERAVVVRELVVASSYLRTFLLALHPELEESDPGATSAALADIGARHRPQTLTANPDRLTHVMGLVSHAAHDAKRARSLIAEAPFSV